MRADKQKVVVCDNGTGVCVMLTEVFRKPSAHVQQDHQEVPVQFVKCGFAGDNFPRASFPCMVGRPTVRAEQGVSKSQLRVHSCWLCHMSCVQFDISSAPFFRRTWLEKSAHRKGTT